MDIVERIYKDRANFYRCEPDLFGTPGMKLIAEESLRNKKSITIAKIKEHLFLRYDPNLNFPIMEFENLDHLDSDQVITRLSHFFDIVLPEPEDGFYYFYKLDKQLPEIPVNNLHIRQISEEDYPALNKFLYQCTTDDLDDADILIEEPDPIIFCGYLSKEIVAYASHRLFSEGIADIGVLIHSEHRQKGYGSALVRKDTHWCLENDVIPMYRVLGTNKGSMALVKKLGFTPLVVVNYFENLQKF